MKINSQIAVWRGHQLSFVLALHNVHGALKADMPNKKNKNQAKNAFYYYMVSLRPQLERQGVVLANGMQSLAELAGPKWKDLPEHEKEVYQEMARQARANKQNYGGMRNDRRDCTGQLLSQRVDFVSLNENKRRRQREEVKSAWPPGRLVCDEHFFFIGFMSLCPASDDLQLPCELGVVEFSINSGIINTMHRFIHPGEIPLGYRYECMSTSEKTHKIPIEGLAREEDTYRRILWDLLRFINPDGLSVFPPVYSRASEIKLTEICLDCLARNAEMPNRLKKVYELEGLIVDLYSHIAPEGQSISKAQATDLISTTVFDYEAGARCEWHDEQEVKYCALGTVKRYSYCMADFLCPHYNVPLTVNHMPERPEGSFCTVLSGQDNGRPASGGRNNNDNDNDDDDDDDNNSYATYSRTDSGLRATAMESYHRSGPTYESDDIQSYRNGSTMNHPSQLPHYEYPQQPGILGGSSGSGAPLGRGRGRGRGVPSSQFVRQPNMAPVGYSNNSEPGYSVGAARAMNNSAPGSVLNYASKGRGVSRVPNTTPKVYAGSASAPHPSFAPPPPLAWQQQPSYNGQQQQQQRQQQRRQQHGLYQSQHQGRGRPYQENNAAGMRNVSDVMNMMSQMGMFENR